MPKPRLTPRRRANLIKLAEYLERLPKSYRHFDMSQYATHEGDCRAFDDVDFDEAFAKNPTATLNHCGTVACAVGHGPAAGIPLSRSERGMHRSIFGTTFDIKWGLYTARNFLGEDYTAEEWLFGGGWSSIDNRHRGAAARIRYYLEHGVPKGWEYPHRRDRQLYADLVVA